MLKLRWFDHINVQMGSSYKGTDLAGHVKVQKA